MDRTSRLSRTGSWVLVLALFLGMAPMYGQTPEQPKGQVQAPRGRSMGPMMDEGRMGAMMAERQQMIASMRSVDQKLDDLVARMNAARGTDKVEAIAAVVNELTAQRKQTRDRMLAMQDGMMRHMMEHMQMGRQAMGNCPMMKELAREGTPQ